MFTDAFSSTSNVGAEAQRPQSDTGRRPTMIDGVSGDASTVPNLTSMKRGPGYRYRPTITCMRVVYDSA